MKRSVKFAAFALFTLAKGSAKVLHRRAVFVVLFAIMLWPFINPIAGGSVSAAQITQKNLVVTVDNSENIYLGLNLIIKSAELTDAFLAAGSPRIYVRGDADVRFDGVAKVLMAAERAGVRNIVLDHQLSPAILPKNILIHGNSMKTLPIAMKDISNGLGLATSGDDAIVQVDFDGTMVLNHAPVSQAAFVQALQQMATKNPRTKIYVWPNRLSKYAYVVLAISYAQRNGLNDVTVVWDWADS